MLAQSFVWHLAATVSSRVVDSCDEMATAPPAPPPLAAAQGLLEVAVKFGSRHVASAVAVALWRAVLDVEPHQAV